MAADAAGMAWAAGLRRRLDARSAVPTRARSISIRRSTIADGALTDVVTGLQRDITAGTTSLAFDGQQGYLRSLLDQAERAGRVATAVVFEDRYSECPHQPRESARALLQRSRHRRLHSRRAVPRDRVARSAAGRDLPDADAGSAAQASSTRPDRCLGCHLSANSLDVPGHPRAQHLHRRRRPRPCRSWAASWSIIDRHSSNDGAGGMSPAPTATRVTWATRW